MVGQFNDTQCSVTALIGGKLYQFRVKAANSEGQGEALVTESYTLAKDPWGKFLSV